MKQKCYRCGSENIIKVVPAAAMAVPEIKSEVEAGKAEVSCGCTGFQTGSRKKCKSCGFQWDSVIEAQLEAESK
ncbi:MAG: hypothetical protein RSD88_08580 [Anaerovoracaceae bacterium]